MTCPTGVVAGVGGFRSPAASAIELLLEDWGVCGPWREPPELAARHKCPYQFFRILARRGKKFLVKMNTFRPQAGFRYDLEAGSTQSYRSGLLAAERCCIIAITLGLRPKHEQ